MDASDALVAAGAQTSFWKLVSEPAGATEALGSGPFRYHGQPYFADTATAAFVSPGSAGSAGVNGFYIYDMTFDLTGLIRSTSSISGIFGSDNDATISLNAGAPVAATPFLGYVSPTSFSFTSGFIAGINTIHIKVDNAGDPTAFFVQFNSATAMSATPEPGTILLTSLGLGALALLRRKVFSGGSARS